MLDPRRLAANAPLRRALRAAALACAILAASCAASKVAAPLSHTEAPPATKLAVAPGAVHLPDAPGLNVEDLSARLRDAVAYTSGVDIVDELSVKAELAACTEAPCPDVVASKYRDAEFVVASSVSRIGDVFLTTVRVQRGATELVRTVAQAPDARVSVEMAGRDAGAKLRDKLVAEGAAEQVAAPAARPVDANDTERGGGT